MIFIPMDDRVLVAVGVEEETTQSGIIIPDTAKKRPSSGLVISVGTDKELKELVEVGNTILFARYGGEDITIEDKDYKVIKRSDILGVLK
jgi:chaperonin GroES